MGTRTSERKSIDRNEGGQRTAKATAPADGSAQPPPSFCSPCPPRTLRGTLKWRARRTRVNTRTDDNCAARPRPQEPSHSCSAELPEEPECPSRDPAHSFAVNLGTSFGRCARTTCFASHPDPLELFAHFRSLMSISKSLNLRRHTVQLQLRQQTQAEIRPLAH